MDNHYALINKLQAKPGKRDEVIQLLIESGKPFDDNPSCILYLVYEDAEDSNAIWVEDVWINKEDHTTAMSQPGMKPFIEKTMPLLEGMPEQFKINLIGGKGIKIGSNKLD